MSETHDPQADPVGYVQRDIWPPLPPPFGTWLGELVAHAQAAMDPGAELAIPEAVAATGIPIPGATARGDGTSVITLERALVLFHLEHLLFPDDAEHAADPIEVFEPITALQLANTADAATVAAEYSRQAVTALSTRINSCRWDPHRVLPVRIDRQGRLTSGLTTLLAIVKANTAAAAVAHYETDHPDAAPYTWRGPTGKPHDLP